MISWVENASITFTLQFPDSTQLTLDEQAIRAAAAMAAATLSSETFMSLGRSESLPRPPPLIPTTLTTLDPFRELNGASEKMKSPLTVETVTNHRQSSLSSPSSAFERTRTFVRSPPKVTTSSLPSLYYLQSRVASPRANISAEGKRQFPSITNSTSAGKDELPSSQHPICPFSLPPLSEPFPPNKSPKRNDPEETRSPGDDPVPSWPNTVNNRGIPTETSTFKGATDDCQYWWSVLWFSVSTSYNMLSWRTLFWQCNTFICDILVKPSTDQMQAPVDQLFRHIVAKTTPGQGTNSPITCFPVFGQRNLRDAYFSPDLVGALVDAIVSALSGFAASNMAETMFLSPSSAPSASNKDVQQSSSSGSQHLDNPCVHEKRNASRTSAPDILRAKLAICQEKEQSSPSQLIALATAAVAAQTTNSPASQATSTSNTSSDTANEESVPKAATRERRGYITRSFVRGVEVIQRNQDTSVSDVVICANKPQKSKKRKCSARNESKSVRRVQSPPSVKGRSRRHQNISWQ